MTRMSARLQHLAVLSFAVVHLLLGFICPAVSSRIYRTNDAVDIEVDDVRPPLSPSAMRNFANPPPNPMMYAVNPYTGLLSQPYPNFPFWPYPHLYKPASSFSDADDVTATSPESRQQNIACGEGPDAPPQRKIPTVGIVGGSDAVKNSWPFIVGLRIAGGKVECGGSIISPTRILTAAHCVNEMSAHEISTMTVSLGMHTQGGFPKPEPENDAQMTRRVTRVVYHPSYNDKTKHFDIAVLTVEPPIVYSVAISPVCLPPFNNATDQFVGKDAAIMGWGRLESGGKQPNVLKQATVQIILNKDCNAQYKGVIVRQQLCASAPEKDSCQGDSGGPLVVQAKAGSTAWTQVGVVSYGAGCADPNFAGVYASVAFFRNWIDTNMKD